MKAVLGSTRVTMGEREPRPPHEETMPIDDKTERRAADARTLSIGALSRATRIPVETLRTWERRYGSPKPVRKPSGHRVYPATAVDHLRRVARLLSHGHRPGEILGLSVDELDSLLSLFEPAPAPRGQIPESGPAGDAVTEAIERMLRATIDLDRPSLMHELRSSWVRLGPRRFLEEIAGTFMVEVGRGWHAGTLAVRHEHFASACVSDFLRAAREPYDQQARGPRIVAAMLPGEGHEGGLLIASTLLALRGYRVLYLGPSTPIEQIAGAVTNWDAEAVAVSVSAAMSRATSTRALAQLRQALPRGVALWVGGAGAPTTAKGIEQFESLAALDARLGSTA